MAPFGKGFKICGQVIHQGQVEEGGIQTSREERKTEASSPVASSSQLSTATSRARRAPLQSAKPIGSCQVAKCRNCGGYQKLVPGQWGQLQTAPVGRKEARVATFGAGRCTFGTLRDGRSTMASDKLQNLATKPKLIYLQGLLVPFTADPRQEEREFVEVQRKPKSSKH